MSNGASAVKGDIVRNLTTRQIARMVYGTQNGRIVVELPRRAPADSNEPLPVPCQTWERWDTEILSSSR